MKYEIRTTCDCCKNTRFVQIENYDRWHELHIVKCRNCGYKDKNMQKIKTTIKRNIEEKLLIPPEQAQRHLVKPRRRYRIEQKSDYSMIKEWWKWYSNI